MVLYSDCGFSGALFCHMHLYHDSVTDPEGDKTVKDYLHCTCPVLMHAILLCSVFVTFYGPLQ